MAGEAQQPRTWIVVFPARLLFFLFMVDLGNGRFLLDAFRPKDKLLGWALAALEGTLPLQRRIVVRRIKRRCCLRRAVETGGYLGMSVKEAPSSLG